MGFISTIMGLFGFGMGFGFGLVVGYFMFIYFQPTEVEVSHVSFLFSLCFSCFMYLRSRLVS